jgi:hypothetical protein
MRCKALSTVTRPTQWRFLQGKGCVEMIKVLMGYISRTWERMTYNKVFGNLNVFETVFKHLLGFHLLSSHDLKKHCVLTLRLIEWKVQLRQVMLHWNTIMPTSPLPRRCPKCGTCCDFANTGAQSPNINSMFWVKGVDLQDITNYFCFRPVQRWWGEHILIWGLPRHICSLPDRRLSTTLSVSSLLLLNISSNSKDNEQFFLVQPAGLLWGTCPTQKFTGVPCV